MLLRISDEFCGPLRKQTRESEVIFAISSVRAQTYIKKASKYIGLTCVALLATIILIFIYLIVTRRRGHHGSNGMSHHGISTLTHNGTLSGLPPGEYGKYD